VATCHARSTETPAGPRPGSPAQRGNRSARPAAARAGTVTARGTVRWRARRWLDGVSTAARCCRRSRGGHGEGAEQGGEDRGAPERRVNGETVPTTSGGGVHRRGGGSGGHRRVEEVLQLGRGEGVRKLQEIPGIGSSGKSSTRRGGRRRRSAEIREGEAGSGGRRRWSGCGEAQALERVVGEELKIGFPMEQRAAECARRQRDREGKKGEGRGGPGREGGVPRRVRTFGQRESGRETSDMGAGTVTGGGVPDRRGRPVSGTGRARVWA
jgi:hypothetical protein